MVLDPGVEADVSVVKPEEISRFICQILFGPENSNHNAPDSNSNSILSSFASGFQPEALHIVVTGKEFVVTQELSPEIVDFDFLVVLLKLEGQITADRPLISQIHVLNIPHHNSEAGELDSAYNDAYEQIRSLISLAVAPYFDFVSGRTMSEGFVSNSVSNTRKKFNELTLSLSHLQQKIQIPDLLLQVAPDIKAVLSNPDAANEQSVLGNTTLLNELTKLVNAWIRTIQSVTSLDKFTSEDGSLHDEVQYWKSLELALVSIEVQVNQPEVKRAIEILNTAKRFQTTLAFQNNLGLAAKLEDTKVYNSLLKDLPIEELTAFKDSSKDLKSFEFTVNAIFSHLKRWKSLSALSLTRMIDLIEMLLREIVQSLAHVLASLNLMSIPLKKFQTLFAEEISPLLLTIENNVKFMVNIIRELMRKRQEKFMIIKIDQQALSTLTERLNQMLHLRQEHHCLLLVLSYFEDSEGLSNELQLSYTKRISSLNAFEFSKLAQLIWDSYQNIYQEEYSSIRDSVALLVNRKLDECVTFPDYICLFQKVKDNNVDSSQLFLSLVDDKHRLRMLDVVHQDIQKIFKLSYFLKSSDSNEFSVLNFLSSLKMIVWDLSLKSKVAFYLNHISLFLGQNWNKYFTGAQIQQEADSFHKKLNFEHFFKEWIEHAESLVQKSHRSGRILKITDSDDTGSRATLNFDSKLYTLISETQDLLSLKFDIPVTLLMRIDDIKSAQPIGQSLLEHLEVHEILLKNTLVKTDHGRKFGFLLEQQKREVLHHLQDVMDIEWSTVYLELNMLKSETNIEDIDSPLKKFQVLEQEIYTLHTMNNQVQKLHAYLQEVCYPRLLACEYSPSGVSEAVELIQEELFKVAKANYSDIDHFIDIINRDVQNHMIQKCNNRLDLINKQFKFSASSMEKAQLFQRSIHTFVFENLNFELSPPIGYAKMRWVSAVNDAIAILESVVPVSVSGTVKKYQDWSSLKLSVSTVMEAIETNYLSALKYIENWLSILRLFHLDCNLAEVLGELNGPNTATGLEGWISGILKIASRRSLLEQAEGSFKIGNALEISFSRIQSNALVEFERFQRRFVEHFKSIVQESTLNILSELKDCLVQLDTWINLDQSGLRLIQLVDQAESYRNLIDEWSTNITLIKKGQTILHKQRFELPADWIYAEQLENKLSNVRILLAARDETIRANKSTFVLRLRSEISTNSDSLATLHQQWSSKKPISGDLAPLDALNLLTKFQKQCNEFSRVSSVLKRVAVVLEVEYDPIDNIAEVEREIKDLEVVWSTLQSYWKSLEDIKLQEWEEVHGRTLKSLLESILTETKSAPLLVRQYSAFDDLQELVKGYLKIFPILSELKNSCVKQRHWDNIFKLTGYTHKSKKLLVTDVLGINFDLHEVIIKNIINQANGEQIIEEGLQAIEQEWALIVFETFSFEGKCRLIKNWNSLFDQCLSNLNTLSSMKNSTYHSPFEAERSSLELKLNNLYNLLNVWIEVQRQWVYLEGVFGNAKEIKMSLPVEASRFNNISFEYLALLKRASQFNLVMEVLSIPNIQSSMEKLSDALLKTRKGLTEYLERQRDLFPRLYFVGNDDLLELIGSSNIIDANKHLKQMFAGIASICYDLSSSTITAVISPQGEVLDLDTPVSLIKFRELTHWLSELESQVKLTLASQIKKAIEAIGPCISGGDIKREELLASIELIANQAIVIASQVHFSRNVEDSRFHDNELQVQSRFLQDFVRILTESIFERKDTLSRHKVRSLIIEIIHQRDYVSLLLNLPLPERSAAWSALQRFHYDESVDMPLKRLSVVQGNFEFEYGYEYQGVVERLASTPLVDKCFLAMSQALAQKLGGSPFGPAGTGKTECIKALGSNLGRLVLVFNCDDTFDYQSIGRILLGICKVGCWGCFDEFNRLDTRILSAISTQIENIETGLQQSTFVEVSGKSVDIHPDTGLFVTMNPGYVGRNELPENLKKLFRAFAMDQPDKEIIADVILASQCFTYSREIANLLIPFFTDLDSTISRQPHYDFGLRTIKSILTKCGTSRQDQIAISNPRIDREFELGVLVKSLRESIAPKLVKEDVSVFEALLNKHFAGIIYHNEIQGEFIKELELYCSENALDMTEEFIDKAWHILQIQENHHGFMLVGEAGSGKTTTYKAALGALSKFEKRSHDVFVIDSKTISKEDLFGSLDFITRDWTDGVFTKILRAVIANLKGEQKRRTWIVFDGDIDPEWAENLNSVLDDNKILTLPNGERLELPPNVRVIFEVDSLKYCTLATVSRCGMVWFDRSMISIESVWKQNLEVLKKAQVTLVESMEDILQRERTIRLIGKIISLTSDVLKTFQFAEITSHVSEYSHIMNFDELRAATAFITHFGSQLASLVRFRQNSDNNFSDDFEQFTSKAILLAFVWAFAGACSGKDRDDFGKYISAFSAFKNIDVPPNVLEHRVCLEDFSWESWSVLVEAVDLEPHHVLDSRTIVPTVDTAMHESLISGVINTHSPLILCGPPGSGKTMTLLRALRDSPDLDVISMNFSKDTSPEALLNTLEQYCEYKKTSNGVVLMPRTTGKWVVVFCDEINLPDLDKYGTQRVISLLRQMVEHGGFWRTSDYCWVSLQNIQFVGACNDPDDPGRHVMSPRFMRHTTIVMVDYPGMASLKLIYTTFNRASLKCAPNLRTFVEALTMAMLDIFQENKERFTPGMKSHYIYSPRELTRWCRGILEALMSVQYDDISSLVRLWFHEGLRLFYDRLVEEQEKKWCKDIFWKIAQKSFPHVNLDVSLKEPILFSTWLTSDYRSTDEEELRQFVKQRLRVFSEEELDVELILFEDLLDHSLRIDRVLRQRQGHMILVGPSTSGKTTLTKFVAWMNGLHVVQLRVHTGFTISQFESVLRSILMKCAKGEKVCFLIDESSILDTSFIERMNSLLANSEVPGLFEGEDLAAVYKLCASESSAQGLILDSDDELYEWFTQQISENLHVVFTVSDINKDKMPQVSSSPALFNRCVMSWMGDWSESALTEVASSIIGGIPLDSSDYQVPAQVESARSMPISNLRSAVVDVLLFIHRSNFSINNQVGTHKFVEFAEMFLKLFTKGESELEENQRHTNVGLDKLKETVLEVRQMREVLSEKKKILELKDADAREMLNKMIYEQNEAERKREFSVEAKIELEKQEVEINKRRDIVMQDLELAEPAVLEAQRGVQNIKKQHLTEMRSMSNPPSAVKMAMESVCILLGYQVNSWRDVQLIVRKDDFIASIVSYDNDSQLTPEMRKYMENVYLSRADYNYETINRASKACGPLLQWVIAQLKYSSILERVGPLREEVLALEESATKSKVHLIAIDEMINELEDSIEKYKSDYSELIREAEKVKVDIASIEQKVNRSLKLIENLTNERERWQKSIKNFTNIREKLVGNSLLAAAFAIYCGPLDQTLRKNLIGKWKLKLAEYNIAWEESLIITSVLSTTTNISSWEDNGLPRDELFRENFAINQWTECAYIIDPTGELLNVLQKSTLPKKLIITSFLDDSFIRVFEDAMRFGGHILIQNAESYNPIIDSVLRKDIVQNGGRKTIQFGNKSLDILSDFRMYLYTKVSLISVSSFIASRTTILNFSITGGNLENQILNISLEHARPEVYTKRNGCIALQSEYQVRLLGLRKQLLAILNEVSGTILDNDEVIESLEVLESESADIDKKMEEAETVMTAVENIRFQHADIAQHSRHIFENLIAISKLSVFYNFSLASFIDIFKKVLNSSDASLENGSFITKMYQEAYAYFSPTLRLLDKIAFAITMALSYYRVEIGSQVEKSLKTIISDLVNNEGSSNVKSILASCYAKDMDMNPLSDWGKIKESNERNDIFKTISPFIEYLLGIDKSVSLMDVFDSFMEGVVGVGIHSESDYNIQKWVSFEKLPILISTSKGFDVSYRVHQVAKTLQRQLKVISMGSKEGIDRASKEIEEAMVRGHWVLVQNIQLATRWLPHLERKLESIDSKNNFRLFLTCNLNSYEIPAGLIATSQVLTYETQPNFKFVLQETFDSIRNKRFEGIAAYKHVCFLLSWYHAVIQERLKYVPASFTRKHDFTDADAKAAAFAIDKAFEKLNRGVVDPELVPWHEIRTLVGSIIYGGKLADKLDAQFCADLAFFIFTDKTYDENYNLIANERTTAAGLSLLVPSGNSLENYEKWIEELPETVPLSWIGLSEDVNFDVKQELARAVTLKIQQLV